MTDEDHSTGVDGQYDPDEGVYRIDSASADELPSMAIVMAMAAIRDVEPTELDPLYEAVDPERLDSFLRVEGDVVDAVTLEFSYHGHSIRAHSDGTIEIDLPDADD